MSTNGFFNYKETERRLIERIIYTPDFTTKTTQECINLSFTLINPRDNENGRSNYAYAKEFFKWLMSGEAALSSGILSFNPWVQRFVDTTGLPDNYSGSYAVKIKQQLDTICWELITHEESRRAYLNILYPTDQVILQAKTTHEFPCTIGLHFMVRDGLLHLIANMRSNNVWSVLPYDVFNFTNLQIHVANMIDKKVGYYHHQMNSAHIFKGDVRRIKTQIYENHN